MRHHLPLRRPPSAALLLGALLPLLCLACPRRPAGPARTSGSETVATPAAEADAATTTVAEPPAPKRRLIGVISPHAGYEYSGAVAGWAYKELAGAAAAPTTDAAPTGEAFPAQVAGGFYPDDPAELRTQVEGFLADAERRADVEVRPVATVIVLAPTHRQPLESAAALAEDAYETPLGRVDVDTALRARLVDLAAGDVVVDSRFFRGEHALEVQLPFLQVALPGARILPVMVGAPGLPGLERLGRALAALLAERDDVVLAVSSDMSHFYAQDEAVAFDQENLAALEALDLDAFDRTGPGQSGLCGYHPVRAALAALRERAGERAAVVRLRYANSGDVTGDRGRVVGYGALALLAGEAAAAAEEGGMYTPQERQALIDIARASVRAAVHGERYEPPAPAFESLVRDGAAFVTLKKDGMLRGCIGHVIAAVPLYRCVAEVARSAATQDYRFEPVTPGEVERLAFEISVLTPPEVVTDPATVVVGRDGLILSRGSRRGLLLPQVPEEQGWDREQFLDGTCRKAGLPPGCWQDGQTRIERFQAVVWGEDLRDIIE